MASNDATSDATSDPPSRPACCTRGIRVGADAIKSATLVEQGGQPTPVALCRPL
ncbi:hypothetical protein QMK19_23175 [Streptomyces sp. H10-C2]|uniref:hypothetical protein n=1 Tax=unclassified Streptomyces TaxID=2593676 RepID=UPI0024B98DFA|nr:MULTISPECIES: hypothetical protein [unclassified Streptomyces]MDJ0342809.1 hypothetical protein [Streptomyces sp. PH10-H1]MDJ0372487.1 hypothetical protein [Streptomyces sp. H10-C2]